MGVPGLALIAAGLALIAIAWLRGRGPWSRYRQLRDQQANIARYEAWRGGVRDSGPTGASVMLDLVRGQVRNAAIIAGVGVVLVVVGLFVG